MSSTFLQLLACNFFLFHCSKFHYQFNCLTMRHTKSATLNIEELALINLSYFNCSVEITFEYVNGNKKAVGKNFRQLLKNYNMIGLQNYFHYLIVGFDNINTCIQVQCCLLTAGYKLFYELTTGIVHTDSLSGFCTINNCLTTCN